MLQCLSSFSIEISLIAVLGTPSSSACNLHKVTSSVEQEGEQEGEDMPGQDCCGGISLPDFLEGDYCLGGLVLAFVDNTVRPFSDLFYLLVVLHPTVRYRGEVQR